MLSIKKISVKFHNQDNRTKGVVKQASLSLVMKGANIIASILIVPMTINYLNPTKYGIWLALSAVVGWIHYFNFGLSNGFRNKFAEAVAKGDKQLAREYVSTTYFALSCVIIVVWGVTLFINGFIDWCSFLKVPQEYGYELTRVFAIVATFASWGMVINIFTSLLQADQKTGLMSVIQGIGQYLCLLSIFILTKVSDGNMTSLAVYYSGVPYLTMLIASIFLFNKKYRNYSPRIKDIRPSLIKNIMGLGVQFFVIYLCLIIIFEMVNIIISREIGPIGVSQYNIANKYFGIVYMVMGLLVAPIWSAYTEAYTLKDYAWMKKTKKKFFVLFLLSVIAVVVMLVLSKVVYHFWIGDSIEIPFPLSIAMAFLIVCQTYGMVYMNMINGIGTMRVQLITYLLFALISWPMFTLLARHFGLVGIVTFPSFVYMVQGLLAHIQIIKIENQTAKGVWLK